MTTPRADLSRRYFYNPHASAAENLRAASVIIRDLQEEVRRLRGDAGPISLHNDLVLNGNRICGVGTSNESTDAVSRAEVQQRALYDEGEIHVARKTLIAEKGIRSAAPAKAADDLVPLKQVRDLVSTGGGSGFVTTDTTNQTIAGQKTFKSLLLEGTLLVLSSGLNNNVSGSSPFMEASVPVGATATVTGITGGETGRLIVVVNTVFNTNLIFAHENANSDATNRFFNYNAANIAIGGLGSAIFIYSRDNRWLQLATIV